MLKAAAAKVVGPRRRPPANGPGRRDGPPCRSARLSALAAVRAGSAGSPAPLSARRQRSGEFGHAGPNFAAASDRFVTTRLRLAPVSSFDGDISTLASPRRPPTRARQGASTCAPLVGRPGGLQRHGRATREAVLSASRARDDGKRLRRLGPSGLSPAPAKPCRATPAAGGGRRPPETFAGAADRRRRSERADHGRSMPATGGRVGAVTIVLSPCQSSRPSSRHRAGSDHRPERRAPRTTAAALEERYARLREVAGRCRRACASGRVRGASPAGRDWSTRGSGRPARLAKRGAARVRAAPAVPHRRRGPQLLRARARRGLPALRRPAARRLPVLLQGAGAGHLAGRDSSAAEPSRTPTSSPPTASSPTCSSPWRARSAATPDRSSCSSRPCSAARASRRRSSSKASTASSAACRANSSTPSRSATARCSADDYVARDHRARRRARLQRVDRHAAARRAGGNRARGRRCRS